MDFFLHEHPANARGWQDNDVMRIMHRRDVRTVTGDMCAFGTVIEEGGDMTQVRNMTRFMTNAPNIADRLMRLCSMGPQSHNN